jgi:hypothetical protein
MICPGPGPSLSLVTAVTSAVSELASVAGVAQGNSASSCVIGLSTLGVAGAWSFLRGLRRGRPKAEGSPGANGPVDSLKARGLPSDSEREEIVRGLIDRVRGLERMVGFVGALQYPLQPDVVVGFVSLDSAGRIHEWPIPGMPFVSLLGQPAYGVCFHPVDYETEGFPYVDLRGPGKVFVVCDRESGALLYSDSSGLNKAQRATVNAYAQRHAEDAKKALERHPYAVDMALRNMPQGRLLVDLALAFPKAMVEHYLSKDVRRHARLYVSREEGRYRIRATPPAHHPIVTLEINLKTAADVTADVPEEFSYTVISGKLPKEVKGALDAMPSLVDRFLDQRWMRSHPETFRELIQRKRSGKKVP